ncbi:ALG14 transferase, partial [Polyodon spathula]|nr:ALG14 transferase [Polyodon spathula]
MRNTNQERRAPSVCLWLQDRIDGDSFLLLLSGHYVIADTDKMSEDKIFTFEISLKEKDTTRQFTIQRIPRSREVQQSWRSSVLTTLYSLLYSVPLVFKLKPDLVCTS